nr:hypothetical protein [Salinisphaera shabanensis]
MAVAFQRAREAAEFFGDIAGDRCADAGRVERERIGPDRPQALANAFVAQVFQSDAMAAHVRIGRVVAAGTGEFGIHLDHVADVHYQQERRTAFARRQGADIAFALASGAFHHLVPGRRAAFAVALFQVFRLFFTHAREQILAAGLLDALLGLADETVAFVEIDEVGGLRAFAVREA